MRTPVLAVRDLVVERRPRMIVMPANATGSLFTPLARETGNLGHLYSPGGQRGPYPWFPYALDNGVFAAYDLASGRFDHARWATIEPEWRKLLTWADAQQQRARFAIVPDVVGDAAATLARWPLYLPHIHGRFPAALAVQDGMTVEDVLALPVQPDVIAVGGSTAWKWATVGTWARAFPRVHVLRVNSPARLDELEALGVESCDGTGWNRGDVRQTSGLEAWARREVYPYTMPLVPHLHRGRGAPAFSEA